jgi:hypothetical protein
MKRQHVPKNVGIKRGSRIFIEEKDRKKNWNPETYWQHDPPVISAVEKIKSCDLETMHRLI